MAREKFAPLPARREHEVAAARTPSFRVTETKYPAGLFVASHAHANASLTFTRFGGLRESAGGRAFENASPESLLVRPPEERHADRVQDSGAVNLEIEILPGAETLLKAHVESFAGVRQVRHPRLSALSRQMGAELRCRDAAQPLVVEGLAFEILGLASRVKNARPSRVRPAWLDRLRERLESSFRDRPLIGDLAREAGVHPVSLARSFRQHFGESPGDCLRRLRVEWAARELGGGSPRTLAEIALDAGFSDQSHFHRVFRRLTGTSPAGYRGVERRR